MSSWYNNVNTESVVSSRVRLARNLADIPFPSVMTAEQIAKVNRLVKDALLESDTPYSKKLKYINMDNVPLYEIYAMVERHIISPEFAENHKGRAMLLSDDETVSVMLCEEDHIRIQVLCAGLALYKAYDIASDIDDIICQKLKIAYSEQLGFLTECPTNLGTGLRASVMLHLPVLQSNNEVAGIAETISKVGFTVRGMYGEGSRSASAMYQVSNQITLGLGEKNAIDNLTLIVNQIIEREQSAQKALDKIQIENLVWRAYGLLKFQRSIDTNEMMDLISRVKLGQTMGIIDVEPTLPIKILIETQPNMICRKFGDKNDKERDVLRSEIIREMLK